jgi:ribonuclease HII
MERGCGIAMHALEAAYLTSGQPVTCGIDEAGRGPLAGPVVAAAVILMPGKVPAGIDDSKKLTPGTREQLYEDIVQAGWFAVGIADVARIDSLNILHATLWAMQEAVRALSPAPKLALIDGNRLPALECAADAIINGDAICVSIAAASIIAKVTRDRLMCSLAREFPAYGFEQHKGYATAQHLAALRRHGPSPHHRRSFAPVAAALTMQADLDSLAQG